MTLSSELKDRLIRQVMERRLRGVQAEKPRSEAPVPTFALHPG